MRSICNNHVGVARLTRARSVLWASLIGYGLSISIGASPILGQPEEKRAELILSMARSSLPFRSAISSKSYELLWRQSGQATRVILPLTRTELWSVPIRNVDSLIKTAIRAGVFVHPLGADWNHLFRPRPVDMSMNAEQKAMMAQAKASRATSAIGIMLPPHAAMIEYALTKGISATMQPQDGPAKIKLQLN
jgi:hypothetical protein